MDNTTHHRPVTHRPARRMVHLAASLVLAGVTHSALALGNASGSTDAAASASSQDMVASGDKKFLTTAAGGGMFEVEVGKLAATKASDPGVKSYGQMLVTDHTAANDKLKAIATAHGVMLPEALPTAQQKALDKLSAKSGDDFDKAFIQEVGLKDHKHDISLFERASKKAKADDVREFATATLPTLKQHLADAEQLKK